MRRFVLFTFLLECVGASEQVIPVWFNFIGFFSSDIRAIERFLLEDETNNGSLLYSLSLHRGPMTVSKIFLRQVTAKGVAPTAKRAQTSKKTDESSEESDSEEDDDDEPQNKKPKVSVCDFSQQIFF